MVSLAPESVAQRRPHAGRWVRPGIARKMLAFQLAVARLCVIVLMALLALDELAVKGLVFPIRVQSGSMIPFLWGPRWETACPFCGYLLWWDATQGDRRASAFRAVCPACGRRPAEDRDWYNRAGEEITFRPGQRILVVRGLWRTIRRWDVLALRDPLRPGVILKRVVGLPGEACRVEGGCLRTPQSAHPRPIGVQWQMADPRGSPIERGIEPIKLAANSENLKSQNRLSWQVKRATTYCYHHPTVDQIERRSTNFIFQVELADCSPHSVWALRVREDGTTLALAWDFSAKTSRVIWTIHAATPGDQCGILQGERPILRRPRQVIISLVDGRWLAMADGVELLDHPREPTAAAWTESPAALSLELVVLRGAIALEGLNVWHVADYLEGPVAEAGPGYVLLGDDPHISQDSRQGGRRWQAQDVVGVVRPFFW